MSQAIQKRIAYIGAGQMCEAIFSGLISSGAILPEHILLYDVNESRLTDLQTRTAQTSSRLPPIPMKIWYHGQILCFCRYAPRMPEKHSLKQACSSGRIRL